MATSLEDTLEIEQKNALNIINGKGRFNFVMQGVLNKGSQIAILAASIHMPTGVNPTKVPTIFKSITVAIGTCCTG